MKATEITAWVLLIVLLVIALRELSFIFMPLSIALLLSFALGMPLDAMRRWGVPSALRIISGVLFVAAAIFLLSILIQLNINAFAGQYERFEAVFKENFYALLGQLGIAKRVLDDFLAGFPEGLRVPDLEPLGSLLRWLGGNFFSFIVNIFWVLLFMIFILVERENIVHRLERALGDERSESFLGSLALINREVQRYMGYKILISFGTGLAVTMVLWLLKVPFALLWGTLAFFLNLAPYVGSIIASLPPVLITLLESGSLGRTLAVAVVITFIQMSIGNVLEPQLMGRRLDLSPLLILLSLVFWGWMWGAVGMLLAIPFVAAIRIALEQIESTRFLAILMGSK